MASFWAGADPTEIGDAVSYELGMRVVVNDRCTLTGVRIWNPGETERVGRNAKLWSTNPAWEGESLVTSVTLPDTMTFGWTSHVWDVERVVTSVPDYYVVSFDCAAAAGGSSDYGKVNDVFAGADTDSADGAMTVPFLGGVWDPVPDTYPDHEVSQHFYGIDPEYLGVEFVDVDRSRLPRFFRR